MYKEDIREKEKEIMKTRKNIEDIESGINGLMVGLSFFQNNVKNRMSVLHIKKLRNCKNSLKLALNSEKANLKKLESELKNLSFKEANRIENKVNRLKEKYGV